MDPEAFTASLFKWDPRGAIVQPTPGSTSPPNRPSHHSPYESNGTRWLGGLDGLFQAYGIRYYTAAKIAELGFTASTLVDMKDEELEDMMNSLSHIFRWDLLVGERYGIKAAVRAERRRIDEEEARRRTFVRRDTTNALDALSQEGLSEEPVQQEKGAAGSGGGNWWEVAYERLQRRSKMKKETTGGEWRGRGCRSGSRRQGERSRRRWSKAERQREHPFIVTEPGEVARGKKNGLDYLFHLYEQCREFLIQVQNIAKERGEKCPTKVTNQVFRYAKKAGASYINKPKMRHYVHCYALHCLDEEESNTLRRAFKERGENVGAWRQACYKPLVSMAARQGWDIDAIFNSHPRLSIWYVPTKLRQLCHAERSNAVSASACSSSCATIAPPSTF
uniref:Floricaula/leafy-like transcription factor n=2 Tax=Nelumbo nucifera TaxID=4432 RepID=M1S0R4_NELNU|nr:leafy [Nelumbo nucifera]